MNIRQQIIENILTEKASIDWNNYLTPEEVEKFLSKDDKVESAENIIYSKEFRPRYKDLHNDLQKKYNNSWNKRELVQDLVQFYEFGNLLTEKEHKLSSYENWRQQIDNMSEEQLKNYISKLYKQYERFDDKTDTNIPPDRYVDLLKKITYIEKKLGYEQKRYGRKLH